MENNQNYLKEYVDRFIRGNYEKICPKLKAIESKISESSCYSSMDKMHDVLLSLYETKETFNDYCSFEKWAMKKFTQK